MTADSNFNQPPVIQTERLIITPAQELISLLKTESFQANFVKVQTEPEQEARKMVVGEMMGKVKSAVNSELYEVAANRLGVTVDDGPSKSVEWGNMIKTVKFEKIDGVTRGDILNTKYLGIYSVEQEYTDNLANADLILSDAETRQRQALQTILVEANARKNDPLLTNAFDVWGRSPNAAGDFGFDNNGHNAGVVHFFEYRSVSDKNGRYKNSPIPVTIDDFVFYSQCYKELLQDIDPARNPNVTASALLKDNIGQIRLRLVTKEGDGIVGFKKVGETGATKIITIIPGQNEQVIMKSIEDERLGKNKSRLNKLGDGIEVVPVSEYQNLIK